MPIPSLPDLSKTDPNNSRQVVDVLAKINKELEWLVQHLDGENIIAGAIQAKHIASEAIQTQHLAAGSVTAEKIQVEELSAISANLGYITAGVLTGVIIQTGETGKRIRLIGDTFETLHNNIRHGPALGPNPYGPGYRLAFYENGIDYNFLYPTGGYLSFANLYGEMQLYSRGFRTNLFEEGMCGVGAVGNGETGVQAGVAVNFKTTKTYTPSYIDLYTWSSNLEYDHNEGKPYIIDANPLGFWIYFLGNGTTAYRYWRGTYFA